MVSQSNQNARSKNVLGRGLRSLIPDAKDRSQSIEEVKSTALNYIDVNKLSPGSGQPRQVFDEVGLEELCSSIKEHGILQPIVIRRTSQDDYEIVAGERRWRAAKRAGLTSVPCLISDIANHDVLKVALVENLQREDLNAIEEAESFQRLQDEFSLTHDQIAQAVGKDRSSVANSLRLLRLPEEVRQLVVTRTVSMGHARALLSLKQDSLIIKMANKIADEQLSVRAAEKLVSDTLAKQDSRAQKTARKKLKIESMEQRNVRRRLESHLMTRVDINQNRGKGTVVLHFSDIEQLNDLIEKIAPQEV